MPVITNTIKKRGGIFANGSGIKKGGSLTPTNDEIKKVTHQINNPSAPIPGLGSGPRLNITTKSEYKPAGNSVSYGGSLPYGLAQLNFNSKKQPKNVKLKV